MNLFTILKAAEGASAAVSKLVKANKALDAVDEAPGILSKAGRHADDVKVTCNCFTAGTTVETDEGEKPIEQIEIGDKVLAKNDETGEMAFKEVEGLYQRDVEETYNITVEGQVITTTDEHPFWVVGTGWVHANNLRSGDIFETSDGKQLTVENIEVKKEHKTVYNFKVKDFHTYFVSKSVTLIFGCIIQKGVIGLRGRVK